MARPDFLYFKNVLGANMIEKQEQQILNKKKSGETFVLFLYSPLCGTCTAAESMLGPLEKLYNHLPFIKANINTMPTLVGEEKIKSIPCLKVVQNGSNVKTIYAFHSIASLVERLHPVINKDLYLK